MKPTEGGLTPAGKTLMMMKSRPAGLTYKGYQKMCKSAGCEGVSDEVFKALPIDEGMDIAGLQGLLSKGSEEEEASEEAPEEEEAEESSDDQPEEEAEASDEDGEQMDMSRKGARKSISAGDLLKSIAAYDATEDALRESGTSRESFLTTKLDSGTLSKSERVELGQIWSGATEDVVETPEDLHKSLYDVMTDDEDAGALVDASDFLKSLVQGMDQRMQGVAQDVSREGRATRELLKAQGSLVKSLAVVVAEQDEIIKSLAGRVEEVEAAPAPRRSVSSERSQVRGRPLSKSTVGDTPDNLGSDAIKKGLRSLMMHASEESDNTAMDKIMHATAMFEQTGNIPSNILAAIRAV